MMNGGDLYELAKLLGHANIKMTERYAKLAQAHIIKTGKRLAGDMEQAGTEVRKEGEASCAAGRTQSLTGTERSTWFPGCVLYCVLD